MKLRFTEIKVNKLSLKEQEPQAPPLQPRPPSQEEIIYSRLVAKNPLIETLVERLGLVSTATGKRINKVEYIITPTTSAPDFSS